MPSSQQALLLSGENHIFEARNVHVTLSHPEDGKRGAVWSEAIHGENRDECECDVCFAATANRRCLKSGSCRSGGRGSATRRQMSAWHSGCHPDQREVTMMADDDQALREEVGRRAYQRFCDRGCQHGSDVDDWLAAERDILAAKSAITADQAQPAQADAKPRRKRAARS